MHAVGGKETRTIRPEFDRSISIHFRGAKITNDTCFLLNQAKKWNKPRRVACKIEWHVSNLLHMIRGMAFRGENVKPSIESIIRRLIKVGAGVAYHARKWQVRVASAFPLARYHRFLFA